MIPVCRDKTSTRPAGKDLTLQLHREFQPGKAGHFSTGYLHFLLIFICNCAKLLFNPPLGAEAIRWENFVLGKWNPGSAKDGSCFARMKLSFCVWLDVKYF